MEDYTVQELSLDDLFCFACHAQVPCFNECCGELDQILTPYDVLRLKNALGLSSSEFLARYTRRHTGDGTGLIVVGLVESIGAGGKCPFVSPEGCRVYDHRPGSCRAYPLARSVSRHRRTGRLTERYLLFKEPHCRGFEEARKQTVRQWVEQQGLSPYNAANDLMMELIAAKNRHSPAKPLSLADGHVFYTGCYDLDRFRGEIFEKADWPDNWFDAQTLATARRDETVLLAVALDWVRRVLFPAA